MKLQKKYLNQIRFGKLKGLPLSQKEIDEAIAIIDILDTAIKSGYTSDSLYEMFTGNPNHPPVKGITPYANKMYRLTGKANKDTYHIRLGNRSGKNRVRFRWDSNGIDILGVGDFHSRHNKNPQKF